MMDLFDVASSLFGSKRSEDSGRSVSNQLDTITAVGASDSSSGTVGVVFDAG